MPPQGLNDQDMAANSVRDMQVADDNETVDSPGCCKRCTDRIILALEGWFAKLGYFVASYPVPTIVIAVIVSLTCLAGLVEYYAENRGEKLWVAADSQGLKHQEWVEDRYPPQFRVVTIIVEDSNVLTTATFKALIEVDQKIKKIGNGTDISWDKMCLPPCIPNTILSLWNYNYAKIKSLDQNAILKDVNNPKPVKFGDPVPLTLLLGEISYDNNKNITGAKATKMSYFLKNQEVFVKSKGRKIDEKGEEWETEFDNVFKIEIPGVKIYRYSITGFQEDSRSSLGNDLQFLFVGYILIIVYLAVMLGSFSRINHKVWLAFAGVICIGLSIGIAYGLSSAFQLFVSPVHNILPFLLLGIGVDDVFVIVQNWNNFGGPENKDNAIPENVAVAMRHAGVSILVTSFTDICAFLIGATTVLPALRSFCIFAGIGVFAVFILTCTFFVAWLALDSRRQRAFRDACLCCITIRDSWQPLECSKRNYLQSFMANTYSKAILSVPGMVVCMTIFVGLLAGGCYGLSELKQDFDFDWFLPPDSQTVAYNKAIDKYFSTEGINTNVYVGEVDYFAEQSKLDELYNKITKDKHIVSELTLSWYENYKQFLKTEINSTLLNETTSLPKSEADFYTYLWRFLDSPSGLRFKGDVKNNTKTEKIMTTRIRATHVKLEGAANEIKAMDSLQESVNEVVFNNGFETFAYTRFYISWETNKIISTELIRNLALAGIIVFLVTLFLIANLWVSLLVVTCVVFTLINIAGYMHFWGLTVDTVTTIQLILAIGLSVDYSAHIGHGFMASRDGDRKARAAHALEEIGPAVVHGGFSTFLAFVFLAGSESYVFSTFFKLFFLVVVFGMFHGLVYLPIMLRLIGPKPYAKVISHEKTPVEMKSVNHEDRFSPIPDPHHKQNGNADNNQLSPQTIYDKENSEIKNEKNGSISKH
ncbi:patched domain-containing protein 3-like isoform X2 [Hydractinia symbiolongicarpus]|uniref:patched domain-containing protein 3-like isoform X2 n=1 Tax=Hydractinia symbiolongicarpus TaxID=13093 RepID=UPI00254C566F|nr:patched domain-containing protein 3-like isoform X2 [Hydractinia symbiolongicarpus]